MTKHLDDALSDLPSHAHDKPALRWTAGPWEWTGIFIESDGVTIAQPIMPEEPEGEANARLMTAAPDMASALQCALTYLGTEHTDDSPEANETREVIRAALRKAGALPSLDPIASMGLSPKHETEARKLTRKGGAS